MSTKLLRPVLVKATVDRLRQHCFVSCHRRYASSFVSSSSSPFVGQVQEQEQQQYIDIDAIHPDASLVDLSFAPSDLNTESAVVYSNVVSSHEESALVADLQAKFKRRRYERGHWDAVILNYKEIEIDDNDLSLTSQRTLSRLRDLLTQYCQSVLSKPVFSWLPCHAIDLHPEGALLPHVDSVRFSGDLVAGLSLLSPSIMRLCPVATATTTNNNNNVENTTTDTEHKHRVDLFLPPLSLYVLTGPCRYEYTHQLLPSGAEFSSTGKINRHTVTREKNRLSIIFRDAKT